MDEINSFWQTNHVWVWIGIAGAVSAISFISAFIFFQRARVIEDFPTSKIRSASQGYVELVGRAKAMSKSMLKAPLSGIDCVWYRYKIERDNGSGKHSHNVTVEKGESNDLFFIRDDTGHCVIDPLSAKKTPAKKLRWYGDTERPQTVPTKSASIFRTSSTSSFGALHFRSGNRYTYTEERIHDGDPLYVIGQFKTVGGADNPANKNNEVRDTLKKWKEDKSSLLSRFDGDGDGNINMQEWDTARQAAEQAAEEKASEMAKKPGINTIGPTGNKRHPFILSGIPQQHLIRRYKWYSGVSLSGFLIAGIIAILVFNGNVS